MQQKGRHVSFDFNHPEGLGICDRSGMVFMHKDLVKQMEYRGGGLSWTGMLVGKDYVDDPNPQLQVRVWGPDPTPIIPARPDDLPNGPTSPVESQADILASLQNFNWGPT